MKLMNARESREVDLKEKVFQGIGDWLAEMSVNPQMCRFPMIYEPELTPEMILETVLEKHCE